MPIRKTDFKINKFHGKIPISNKSEAAIRNALYSIGMIKINISRGKTLNIRLIGFEIPLETGKNRGKCVDLIGYDQDHNFYIIELKIGSCVTTLADVVKQIIDYENIILDKSTGTTIKDLIQSEFNERNHLSYFKFTPTKIFKVILCERNYYKKTLNTRYAKLPGNKYKTTDIFCCYYSKTVFTTSEDLLYNHGSKGFVSISITNK